MHQVAPTHGRKVFDAYFRGEPPFKGLKNREDIPDAFIWHVVDDVAKELQRDFGPTAKLHVVSQDKRLASAFKAIQGVECFESLDVFVTTAEFNAHNKEFSHEIKLQQLQDNLYAYDTLLRGAIYKVLLKEAPSRTFDRGIFKQAISDVVVARVDTVTRLDLHYEAARMLAVDILVLPFTCELEAEVEYEAESSMQLTQLVMTPGVSEARLARGPGLAVCRIAQDATLRTSGSISLSFELNESEVADPRIEFIDDIKSASVSLEEISAVEAL